jgi:YVTN family beta-propeller protein
LLLAALFPLLVSGCSRRHFPQYPPDYREYAWVTNGGDNTVTVIDLVNMQEDTPIRVGSDPTAIAVNPREKEVYVANRGSGTISVIDAAKNRVEATIAVHRGPSAIAVDGEGLRAYVANTLSNNVSVIDLRTRRVIGTVGVGEGPDWVRIAPDGGSLVVANGSAGSVSIVDPQTLQVRSVFSGCPEPSDPVILPDSSKTFIACTGGHQVMAVSLARPKSAIRANHEDHLLAFLDVGAAPAHLALKPDGGEIFVENSGSDTISEIATTNNEVGGSYTIGEHPDGGIVSADNSTLWVSNAEANTVAAYSIDYGQLLNTVQVGNGPGPMAFSDGGFLVLALDRSSGDVSVIRTISYTPKGDPISGSLFTVFATGKHPNALAVKGFSEL